MTDQLKLLLAAVAVVADHYERVRLYPEQEQQPNRVAVMAELRKTIVEVIGGRLVDERP